MIRVIIAALLLTFVAAANETVDTDGHKPGRFTMDLDAAKAYAKEKKLPLLYNFTGSDWCGWCKLMDKNVFSKDEWAAYAKDNVVMVWIDFPKDKSLVPQKYVERNNALNEKYGVKGFPTYLVIDPETDSVLGKLGAGQGKTPQSFKAELEGLLSFTESRVKATAKALGGDTGSKYIKDFEEMKASEKALKEAEENYRKTVAELTEKIKSLKNGMEETRVLSKLTKEQAQEFLQLRKDLKSAEAEMQAFIDSKPQNTPENVQKYQGLNTKIKDIQSKLSKY